MKLGILPTPHQPASPCLACFRLVVTFVGLDRFIMTATLNLPTDYPARKETAALRIDHWKGGRFFALYDDDDDLVAVFVYRKGAEAVRTKFEEFKEVINATSNRGVARFSTTTPQSEPK